MVQTQAAAPMADAEPISAFGFDPLERALLPVLRHFLTSLDQPDTQSWQHAYVIAAEQWGDSFGLPLAQALLKVVRFLTACRDGVHYHDPLCLEARRLVSQDEAAFLSMLHHMRRDQAAEARAAVEVLTQGRMDPDLIRAGLSLAHRFPAGKSNPVGASRPTLRLVG